MVSIFDDAQRSTATHKSCARRLAGLLLGEDEKISEQQKEELLSFVLRGCLDRCLVHVKKEPTVERTLRFISDFLSTAESSVFRMSMEHLLSRSMATDKTVRYRACQTIANIISSMSGDAVIEDDLWANLISTLTPRLRDKAPNVRMWAIKALMRLQDGENDEDEVISEYMRLMSSDVSAAVRVAAVDNICVCKRTLKALLSRVRDIKSEVRIAAYERISKEVDIRHMSTSMRNMVLQFGLHDRDLCVKAAARDLVLKWTADLDNKVPKLLQLINLSQNEETVELLGHFLMNEVENGAASQSLKQVVNEMGPNWEAGASLLSASEIMWAQLRCEYAQKNFQPTAAADMIESLIPDTVVLCRLLTEAHDTNKLADNGALQLNVRYLLRTTSFLDASDVSGGSELVKICERLLLDLTLPESLVEPALDAWVRGRGRADHASNIASIMSLCEQIQAAADEAERASGAVASESDAALSEFEILAKTRGLQLVAWTLHGTIGGSEADSKISQDFVPFVMESLQSSSAEMRCIAVKCLGVLSLASEASCDQHCGILYQV